MKMLAKAIALAATVFKDKRDKQGKRAGKAQN